MAFIEELAVRKNDPKPKAEPKPKPVAKPWWEKDAAKVRADKLKKGSGKGKDKGRGKSKPKTIGGFEVIRETPDRRLVCFKFNNGEECDGSCGMVHCCRVKGCMSTEHPMVQHPGFDRSA